MNALAGFVVWLSFCVGLWFALDWSDHAGPRWVQVCTASHTESSFILLPNGSNGITYLPTTDVKCDRYEWQCLQGKKYEGDVS